jgi:hypothetical protein
VSERMPAAKNHSLTLAATLSSGRQMIEALSVGMPSRAQPSSGILNQKSVTE